jgi:hypothetical protein
MGLTSGEGIPNDAEQLAAEAGIITDEQQRVIDIQNQQVADRAQTFLDHRTAKKIELQEGFESVQDKAKKARDADIAALNPPPVQSKGFLQRLFGGDK